MPKNKRQKYERVRHLPNVTIMDADEVPFPEAYPWDRVWAAGSQTILELGCGKGEYSLALAAANPNDQFVGVDYKSHRICVGAEKALAGGVGNVHFLRTRVERLHEFFRPHSIHAIWLTFPDPHLKHRKAKCRLTAAPFLDLYAAILVPGGLVHLRTDCSRLYRYTRETVLQWGGQIVASSKDIHGRFLASVKTETVRSAYEEAALSRGGGHSIIGLYVKRVGALNAEADCRCLGGDPSKRFSFPS